MGARKQPLIRERSIEVVAETTHLMDVLGDANLDTLELRATMNASRLLQCAESQVPNQQHLACAAKCMMIVKQVYGTDSLERYCIIDTLKHKVAKQTNESESQLQILTSDIY